MACADWRLLCAGVTTILAAGDGAVVVHPRVQPDGYGRCCPQSCCSECQGTRGCDTPHAGVPVWALGADQHAAGTGAGRGVAAGWRL